MFTGIVKELGKVRSVTANGVINRIEIESSHIYKGLDIGDSVSVNGVCLTLVKKDGKVMSFDAMRETMRRSTLKNIKAKDAVNMEGALKPENSVGGHFVLGHIDCVGRITDFKKSGEIAMTVSFPEEFDRLIVDKGSVALDGVSLTIGHAGNGSLGVYIIPHTLENTTLGGKKIGDEINIEFDIVGKYVARAKGAGGPSGITEELLRKNGF